MTPQILLDALRHTYLSLDQIKVLIFDECHNARGKHQYACIMTEFYHPILASKSMHLPRVFGMTASPIKAKASGKDYWKQIRELENLMHSKVFTCETDSVYIPFSTPKLKLYDRDKPCMTIETLEADLQKLAHRVGALTDNLVPDMVEEETEPQGYGNKPYIDLDADRGKLTVHVQLVGHVTLSPKEVVLCQQFQVKLFNLLMKRNLDKPLEDDQHSKTNGSAVLNYLLFPALGPHNNISIDWSSINSVLYENKSFLV